MERVSEADVADEQPCPHCNGYGSSLKDPIGVDTCTRCGGDGRL